MNDLRYFACNPDGVDPLLGILVVLTLSDLATNKSQVINRRHSRATGAILNRPKGRTGNGAMP